MWGLLSASLALRWQAPRRQPASCEHGCTLGQPELLVLLSHHDKVSPHRNPCRNSRRCQLSEATDHRWMFFIAHSLDGMQWGLVPCTTFTACGLGGTTCLGWQLSCLHMCVAPCKEALRLV